MTVFRDLVQHSNLNCFHTCTLKWNTNLNNSKTDCGNVWKLLFLLMYVPSTKAILPNICRENAIQVKECGFFFFWERGGVYAHIYIVIQDNTSVCKMCLDIPAFQQQHI